MRDDFAKPAKRLLAARAGHRCSNPSCRAHTSGPQLDETKALNLGVAAHITAAAPGGPRYDLALSSEDRSNISNAIWLCQNCAKLVDNDTGRFSVQTLNNWRRDAEKQALRVVGRSHGAVHDERNETREQLIQRKLALRDTLARALLLPASERREAHSPHPYSKFRVNNLIIRSLDDEAYPNVDKTPGISSWFRVEPFDFYHNGIEVILTLRSGVIDEQGYWDVIEYDAPFDTTRFQRIKVWVIGRIPYQFIRAHDLDGDEYYAEPHLYCLFGYSGEPYEEIRHALCSDGEEYDWPLDAEKRIVEVPKSCDDT